MKRASFAFLFSALIAASPLAAAARSDKELDAVPAGLTPSAVTVSQLLKTNDAAVGKRAAGLSDTSTEQWTFDRAGLHGSETLLRSGFDFYARLSSGPLAEEYGQFLGRRWHRDYNGVVSPMSTEDFESFEMLAVTDFLNDAADPKNDVKVVGESAEPAAYVVSIKKPQTKHPEYAYYDKKTGLVDRVTFVSDDERVTISYDDYRATSGWTQPWHIHVSTGTRELDDDFKRTSLSLGVPVDSMRFTMPASSHAFATYGGTQKLPAKVIMDKYRIDIGQGYYHEAESPTVVVRLNVGGRGLDFSVSAGSPRTLIDSQVAQQLGLPTFGQVTHAAGKDVPFVTVLPAADMGGVALRNMAVQATPFNYHLNYTTKVVGVIGADVLSSGIFKIDFDKGTMEAYPLDYDTSSLGADQQSTLALRFDDGYPFFAAVIDSHETPNVLFDNDFEFSYIFGGFVDRYPKSVTDAVTGHSHATATIPFADSGGYGKEVSVYLGKLPDIQLGPAHFVDYEMVTVDGDVSFEGHAIDAVMGGDVLRYYDVYLDFPHNRVFLKPNKSFFNAFKLRAS